MSCLKFFSSLLKQWFGDAEKLTKALFSFASRLAPVIIFVDEVSFFSNRHYFNLLAEIYRYLSSGIISLCIFIKEEDLLYK